MDYQHLIETMSLQTYQDLKRAVELGKWPNGDVLSREQREHCMQAVIAWGRLHLQEDERVGHIDKKHKEGDSCDEPTETTITWKESI